MFRKKIMEKTKRSIKRYWNWRSKSYGYDGDKSIKITRKWETILKDLVSDVPGRHALDIGTGRGQFAIYLARLGFNVTGIDLSESMISLAGKHALLHELNIDFQTGDAEKLNFKDNTFDVVVSRNLLWTLHDPEKALKEWRRVMKPGGTLVVSDGLWMNYTWKRIHKLAFNLIKRMFQNDGMISLLFFLSYAGLQKSLPFYEGICFKEAGILLQSARFKDIRSYDTSCFETNPYFKKKRINNREPVFFIAHAKS